MDLLVKVTAELKHIIRVPRLSKQFQDNLNSIFTNESTNAF